jgi:hypothetical protein
MDDDDFPSAIASMAYATSTALFEDYLVGWSGTKGRAFASH